MRPFFAFAAITLMTASLNAGPLIVAHRGASGDAPENTLPAFRLAWEQKADAIEGDFHLTSDEQIVCWHDFDTEKRAGVKHVIAASTLAQIQVLDAGKWKGEKWIGTVAPTLAQSIATVPAGKKFYIEVKSGPETVPPLIEVLDLGALADEQIVMISFNRETVRTFKAARPHLTCNWLTSFREDEAGQMRPTAAELIATVQELNGDGVGFKGMAHIDQPFVDTLRAAGLGVHVWTINDSDDARRFRDLGVDSITTDFPARIRAALATSDPH